MYLTYLFPRKYKVMSVLLIVLLIWIFAVKVTSNFIISKATETEEQIIKEKNEEREKQLDFSFNKLANYFY